MPSSFLPRLSLRSCGATLAAGALLAAGGVQSVRAGAFSLSDQSPGAVGVSFAGAAASAEDPSSIFFNPASMGFLDGFQTESSYTYIKPHAEFDNSISRYSFGLPIRGSDGGGAARGASFGDSFLSATLLNNEKYGKLNLGIAVTVPFGEVVDYDPNWVGRYSSLRSQLRTIDYGLSASYRWKFISIGAGFDAQYSSAVLSNAIDFGLLGASRRIPGFAPGSADGVLRLEGSDVSYGFNVGAIVEYLQPGQIPGLGVGRFGVSYRSGITQNYSGYVAFRDVPAVFQSAAFGGAFQGQAATAKLKEPETYHFSFSQNFLGKVNFLGDLTYTKWNRLDEIPITFSNPISQASLVSDPGLKTPGIAVRYEDTIRITGGIEYMPFKDLTLRVGGGYDESPVPSKFVRSSRIPDGDRWLVSTGVKYHAFGFRNPIFKRVYVDTDVELAYLHLFIDEPSITSVDTSGHILNGKYHENVNVFSAALIFRYGMADAPPKPAPKDGKDTYRK